MPQKAIPNETECSIVLTGSRRGSVVREAGSQPAPGMRQLGYFTPTPVSHCPRMLPGALLSRYFYRQNRVGSERTQSLGSWRSALQAPAGEQPGAHGSALDSLVPSADNMHSVSVLSEAS